MEHPIKMDGFIMENRKTLLKLDDLIWGCNFFWKHPVEGSGKSMMRFQKIVLMTCNAHAELLEVERNDILLIGCSEFCLEIFLNFPVLSSRRVFHNPYS